MQPEIESSECSNSKKNTRVVHYLSSTRVLAASVVAVICHCVYDLCVYVFFAATGCRMRFLVTSKHIIVLTITQQTIPSSYVSIDTVTSLAFCNNNIVSSNFLCVCILHEEHLCITARVKTKVLRKQKENENAHNKRGFAGEMSK